MGNVEVWRGFGNCCIFCLLGALISWVCFIRFKAKKQKVSFFIASVILMGMSLTFSHFMAEAQAKDYFTEIFSDPVNSVSNLRLVELRGRRKGFKFDAKQPVHIREFDHFEVIAPSTLDLRTAGASILKANPWITKCREGTRRVSFDYGSLRDYDPVDCEVFILSDPIESRYWVYYEPKELQHSIPDRSPSAQ